MMKRRHLALVLLFALALSLRLYRFAHFHVLPESDVYYYLNVFNGIVAGGALFQGFHPGFNAFMGLLGRLGLGYLTLFVYVGPFLGALLVFAMYAFANELYDYRVGLLSAFFIAVTPLSIIRNGQTIAETLAYPLLVMYLMLLYDASRKPSRRSILLVPVFVLIFFIHNLTGAVVMFLTLVGFLFYLVIRREYKWSAAIAFAMIAFVSVIYFTPTDKLPAFRESYEILYRGVKQYFSTFSFGADTSLSWKKFDLLFPTVLLAAPGLLILAMKRRMEDIFVLVIFLTMLFLTQLFRVGFNFLPHRFLIYLAIPLSIAAARFVLCLYDNFEVKGIRHSKLVVLLPLALILCNALTFSYNFNFLISNEDFESLDWARGNIDGNVVTYSKIDNSSQDNKYAAVSDQEVELKNSFFNTGIVDYGLLKIVSDSFGVQMGQSPPDGATVYYTSLTKEYASFVKLNRGDRCLTSLEIIRTFWGVPEVVGICDAIEYTQGLETALEYNLPLILYSNERYDEVISALESWGCEVVLLDDIGVLEVAFDVKGIACSYGINEKLSYDPLYGIYLYYDRYSPLVIEDLVKEYLYLSKEAQDDFPDLEENCDRTILVKVYDTSDTSYYVNI